MIQFRGTAYGIRAGNNCPRNLYLVPWAVYSSPDYRGERNDQVDELAGQVDYDQQAELIVAAVAAESPNPARYRGLYLPWSVDHLYHRVLLTEHGTPFGLLYEGLAVEVVEAVNRYTGW